jgi:hypothetical protein
MIKRMVLLLLLLLRVQLGHLCHITDDVFEDAVAEDIVDDATADVSNDTNEEALIYFARTTNHYLHLVESSSSENILLHHEMRYPIIADSGANYHMFKEREFCETLQLCFW